MSRRLWAESKTRSRRLGTGNSGGAARAWPVTAGEVAAGSPAAGSLLANVTVPVNPVATLPAGSRTVTVTEAAVPAARYAETPDSSRRAATPVAAGRSN